MKLNFNEGIQIFVLQEAMTSLNQQLAFKKNLKKKNKTFISSSSSMTIQIDDSTAGNETDRLRTAAIESKLVNDWTFTIEPDQLKSPALCYITRVSWDERNVNPSDDTANEWIPALVMHRRRCFVDVWWNLFRFPFECHCQYTKTQDAMVGAFTLKRSMNLLITGSASSTTSSTTF